MDMVIVKPSPNEIAKAPLALTSSWEIQNDSDGQSYNISNVPVEIWSNIGRLASRPSLARLCSVSHPFCSVFYPLLYANTVEPPITPFQSALLAETLSEDTACSWKPHPASLIRQLGLTHHHRWTIPGIPFVAFQEKILTKALRNLDLMSPPVIGSNLHVLHWTLPFAVDELGGILGGPGKFPHLKELKVSSWTLKNFNFINARALEVLKIDIEIDTLYENASRMCYRLAEALQMLPISSPFLRTFGLRIGSLFSEATFPFPAYSDLMNTMNLIYLPALTTLSISVQATMQSSEVNIDLFPTSDFSPFLGAHPKLVDLKLSAGGTRLPEEETSALSSLLQKLVITVVPDPSFFPWPRFDAVPLPTHSSLTDLRLYSIHGGGMPMKIRNELAPESFTPGEYCDALKSLTKLRGLRLQIFRESPSPDDQPPLGFEADFDHFLPSLPQLTSIEICYLIDIPHEDGDEPDFTRGCYPADMTAEYSFSVIRDREGIKVVLDSYVLHRYDRSGDSEPESDSDE
ncbi:hypothetical protein C8R46DRAFT_1243968 [Mycena filopes]|nr:hypothetical protein C8R46DRAFT_1243968 [Mycena filopes]